MIEVVHPGGAHDRFGQLPAPLAASRPELCLGSAQHGGGIVLGDVVAQHDLEGERFGLGIASARGDVGGPACHRPAPPRVDQIAGCLEMT